MLIEVMRWVPRVLGLVLTGFCYLLVFVGGFLKGRRVAVVRFVQGTVLLILTLVSWRWPIPGGILYIGSGVFARLKRREAEATAGLVVGLILAVIGVLFILFGVFVRRNIGIIST